MESRRPFTCLGCWERTGTNIDLVELTTTFDNRSVEVKTTYQCPECMNAVRISL